MLLCVEWRMHPDLLFDIFIFLAAACLLVPLVGRLELGSVMGYLIAGVTIGPFGLGFIGNPEQVMHFAEFGVIMMLFLIGLELEPATLWKLRKSILGLGSLQVTLTSAGFAAIGMMLDLSWQASLTIGMALALSSTAIVLQMLEEKSLLQTSAGESAFSVLLFQDIAVIPILLLLQMMAGSSAPESDAYLLSGVPPMLRGALIVAVITAIVVIGRYPSRYLFRFLAKTNAREVFTAGSLALVVGITLLMQAIGLSPALGAFVAGVVLAGSEYRHTMEADIQPFKGLLLGLFFISVGMGMDFSLLAGEPWKLLTTVLGLMTFKALLLGMLGYGFGLRDGQNALFSVALAQGGEFAFVLFQFAGGLDLLDQETSAFLTLAVALSMALTPLVLIFSERVIIPRFMSLLPERQYDTMNESAPVIIAGYGRFGQIIGRFLQAQGVKVTVLEKDPDQIEQLRKFGARAYFGDASRLELLHNAGAKKAKLLVVAVDDPDKCLEIVRLVKEHFPNLTVFARARNRRHAYELYKAGADYFRREMFDSSLTMAQAAMGFLGADHALMQQKALQFLEHDEKTLRRSFEFFEREPELISFSRQATGELERILQADVGEEKKTPTS